MSQSSDKIKGLKRFFVQKKKTDEGNPEKVSHETHSDKPDTEAANAEQIEPAPSVDNKKTQNSSELLELETEEYEREYDTCIKSSQVQITSGVQRNIHCKVCVKFPAIVRRMCANNKPPAITLESGTRYRAKTVADHFATPYHKECKQADTVTKQRWYKGIFATAEDQEDDYDEDYLLESKSNNINF
ncbi:uncharacterized protein LOC129568530 [Sitodiplosis mosellana]|uniref:uncharacterized protein LOC129568530 n=1 Tax=Sitodiplosis mosellana TaxID=263140 RepID=UPI0024443BBD|nr:uncharacterized protein LOC129568530 [Sitodiplosis mosellana]